jgi:NTP pyrophosphatase (non-canonical NTP hydrolase)
MKTLNDIDFSVLNDLAEQAYETAKSKGFYETPPDMLSRLCLIHSEVSEVCEEYRNGHLPNENIYEEDGKLCGIPSEIGDIIIRALDFAAYYEIDIAKAIEEKMKYNLKRPYKHNKII